VVLPHVGRGAVGATGIVVPHVDTAEDARNAVQSAHFPPLGDRRLMAGQAVSVPQMTIVGGTEKASTARPVLIVYNLANVLLNVFRELAAARGGLSS
jgi:hypothetical protein